jgi:hypothetical protein
MKQKDNYHEPITYIYPNAVVRVYRPILTPEERERRMKAIAKSQQNFLKTNNENASVMHRGVSIQIPFGK